MTEVIVKPGVVKFPDSPVRGSERPVAMAKAAVEPGGEMASRFAPLEAVRAGGSLGFGGLGDLC